MISSRNTFSKILGKYYFKYPCPQKPTRLSSFQSARTIVQPRLDFHISKNTPYNLTRLFSTMATATEIHLQPATDSGVFAVKTTEDAARVASEVLQEDMENHHVFFNDQGFHSMWIYLD